MASPVLSIAEEREHDRRIAESESNPVGSFFVLVMIAFGVVGAAVKLLAFLAPFLIVIVVIVGILALMEHLG